MKSKALVIAFGLLLCACSNKDKGFDATGIFEVTEVVVSAKGTGEIKSFKIEEGMDLDSGSIIGCVDTVQLQLKKEQLIQSKASLKSRILDVSKQVSALKEQVEKQKKERDRYQTMYASDATTKKQVEDISSQLTVLEGQYAAQLENITNNNSSLDREVGSIDAQIAQINDQIKNSIIQSPIRGTVLTKYAQEGEFASAGRGLFKIADIRKMYLRAYVSADQLTEIKIGQRVEVFADRGKSERKKYEGAITWISDKAEFTPKTIQTRDERANLVYALKVEVKNDGLIKKGMYGEAKWKK